jgi:hypothetical protein
MFGGNCSDERAERFARSVDLRGRNWRSPVTVDNLSLKERELAGLPTIDG